MKIYKLQTANCRLQIAKSKIFYYYFIIFIILLLCCCKKTKQKTSFSTIEVDKENKIITFNAQTNFTNEEKYFIFYFEGYPWLKEHCFFISSSTLKELQTAVALIDWELWDKIYTKKFSPKLKIEVFYNNQWQNFENLISFKNFDTYQTIFWGEPSYDNIVLEKNYSNFPCSTCKILPLEKNIILADKKILNYQLITLLKNREELKVRIKFK